MTTNKSAPETTPPTPTGLPPVQYLGLVALQTVGAVIVLVNGVPIYRQIHRDVSHHEPNPSILWWALAAVVLIQGAYWIRIRLQPLMPRNGHVVLGHLAGFIARLSFVFTSSTFAVVFLARFDQLSLTWPRILLVIALLFSMFCYTLELERLGHALNGSNPATTNPISRTTQKL